MKLDLNAILQDIECLRAEYPELEDDEQLFADMVEGETDLNEYVTRFARYITELEFLQAGIKQFRQALADRDARYTKRIDGLRAHVLNILQAAHLKKLETPVATLSVRNNPQRLIGNANPDDLPDEYVRITRAENRTAIRAALVEGIAVPGYALSNAEPSLSMRVK